MKELIGAWLLVMLGAALFYRVDGVDFPGGLSLALNLAQFAVLMLIWDHLQSKDSIS